MRYEGSRPSPAMIVAMIALVVALAGTAVAAEPPTRAISKSKAKRIAIKQINKLAPDLSVAHASTADTAGNAENVLWAVVDNPGGLDNATLARAGQPNTTVTEVDVTGVRVEFGRPVTDCAWIATKGAVANATPPRGEVTTAGVAGNPEAVVVEVLDGTTVGGHLEEPFHLKVIC